MPVDVPSASNLGKSLADFKTAQANAMTKKKSQPRTYVLQSVNPQLSRDADRLMKVTADVVELASDQPVVAKLYKSEVQSAKDMWVVVSQTIADKTVMALMADKLQAVLAQALPLFDRLLKALRETVTILYQSVALTMKSAFVGGDFGLNSAAVKYAVGVDLPAHGGTGAGFRTYLMSGNGTVKNWYKAKFGLR